MRHLPCLVIVLSLVVSCARTTSGGDVSEPEPVRYQWDIPIDSFRIDTSSIRHGETLGGIFRDLGASNRQLADISTLPRSVFDNRQLRRGQTYYAFYRPDSSGVEQLRYFVLQTNIRTVYRLTLDHPITVQSYVKSVDTVSTTASVGITTSLWNAMISHDLPVELALELSDIYAWTIDFFALQQCDSIRVLYDELYVDTTRIGIGRIHAANFYHGHRWQEAFWFDCGDIHNYFDADGQSLRKAFLKAPLNYKRISSRFTYARKHPIYRVVRPHTGIDYAAPKGTPVVSIGDGVVTFRQYKGGGGNTVKIRHNSTYSTAYLHLSGYAKGLKVGDRVLQGQVIGYVGSTGSSTGPHLDFRVWKNGSPIDPLKMQSPPAEPIPAHYRETFDTLVSTLRSHIQPLPFCGETKRAVTEPQSQQDTRVYMLPQDTIAIRHTPNGIDYFMMIEL